VGTRRSVSRRTGDVVGDPFFSGEVGSIQLCGVSVKGSHVRGLPVGSVRQAYMYRHGKRTCCVDRVFPCMVYTDSNHRDSQI
jgi:hypothetical protein